MSYLGLSLIALAVIAVVAVAAVAFEPANPFAPWLRLAERYGSGARPAQVSHTDEPLLFGGPRGTLRPLGDATLFDALVDEEGLWLVMKGARPEEGRSVLKIPGTHIRFAGQKGEQFRFDIFAEPPVRVGMYGQIGKDISERLNGATG